MHRRSSRVEEKGWQRMSTENEVAWLFELEVPSQNRPAFDALAPEMIEETKQSEPGSRAYQIFVGDGTVSVYERYDDSDAALVHMKNFGEKFAERFMALVTPVRFTLLGNPSQALLDVVGPIGAQVNTPLAGYIK
jgi:quinol monooxygenase YgiN